MAARRLGQERGASAVEFAMIVPLLVLLVVGIAEFGHAFSVQGTLSAAAREGARVMALQNDRASAQLAVRTAASAAVCSRAFSAYRAPTSTAIAVNPRTGTISSARSTAEPPRSPASRRRRAARSFLSRCTA